MPKFTVLSRKDAFVDYVTEVEAETPEQAVDIAYKGGLGMIVWEDARRRGVRCSSRRGFGRRGRGDRQHCAGDFA